jgi:pantothenate kinase type III
VGAQKSSRGTRLKRGLLTPEQMKKLSRMKEEAGKQEQEMQKLVEQLTQSNGLDSGSASFPNCSSNFVNF